jgi:TonB family protein
LTILTIKSHVILLQGEGVLVRLLPYSESRKLLIVLFLAFVSVLPCTAQQGAPAPAGRALGQLTALTERLASQFLAQHKKKLVVLDLTLPESGHSPLGALLGDQISRALELSHPELEVIPRSNLKSVLGKENPPKDSNERAQQNTRIAKALGAKLIVQGMFCAVPDGIGITLTASDWPLGGRTSFEALGEIPLTAEMQSSMPAPLPERPTVDGIYKAGVGGIGSPVCKKCRDPQYPESLRSKRIEGEVVLEVVVTTEGKAGRIRVRQSSSPELADSAVSAVRQWQFKPATNPRGEPTSVVVPIELSFRLFR